MAVKAVCNIYDMSPNNVNVNNIDYAVKINLVNVDEDYGDLSSSFNWVVEDVTVTNLSGILGAVAAAIKTYLQNNNVDVGILDTVLVS